MYSFPPAVPIFHLLSLSPCLYPPGPGSLEAKTTMAASSQPSPAPHTTIGKSHQFTLGSGIIDTRSPIF